MPRYDYECYHCGSVQEETYPLAEFQERRLLDCPDCKRATPHNLVVRAVAVEDWGQGRWFEHLGPKGMTFYDKASYKRHLKANGLVEWSPKRGMPGQVV